jgi:VWFA-related protein
MTRLLVGASLALVLIAGVALPGAAQDAERYVYVTVLGRDGVPITGLTTDHFAIRESGQDRPVVRVEPLEVPMHVAVLVDTSGHQGPPEEGFRKAVIDFVSRLAAGHHVAVYSFGDRAIQVAGYTQDEPALRAAVTNMFGTSHERSQFIDAIDLALRDFSKLDAKRPVIVAITSESPESSGRTAGGVIKRLIAQSVVLHTLSVATATGSARATTVDKDIPSSSRRLGGMAAAGEGDRERNQMVEQGTAGTGGSRQRLTNSLALAPALTRLTRELSSSYLVTFTRRGGGQVRDLQVGVMVDDVVLRATAAPHGTR